MSKVKSERNFEIATVQQSDLNTFEPQLSQRTEDQVDKNVTPVATDTAFVKHEDTKPKRQRIRSIMNEALGTEDFGNYDYQGKKD